MTVGVDKKHIGIPRVNPCRFNVAIKGTLKFLVRGKVQGAPSMGVSWLVSIGVLAIVSDLTNN